MSCLRRSEMSTILGINEKKKSVKSSMTKLKIARKIIGMLYKDDLVDDRAKRISRSFVFFGTYFRSIFFSKVI